MNRSLLYSALVLTVGLVSCMKEEKRNIIGTWRIAEFADDTNGNNVQDASEVRRYSDAELKYVFKKNGDVQTPVYGFCATGTSGTWRLVNDGKVLELNMEDHGPVYRYDIQALTNKELKTQTDYNTGNGTIRGWMTLEKL